MELCAPEMTLSLQLNVQEQHLHPLKLKKNKLEQWRAMNIPLLRAIKTPGHH